MRADSPATRTSAASASAKPPPQAAPCTAAMIGCGARRISITSSLIGALRRAGPPRPSRSPAPPLARAAPSGRARRRTRARRRAGRRRASRVSSGSSQKNCRSSRTSVAFIALSASGRFEREPGEMAFALDGQRLVHAAVVRRRDAPVKPLQREPPRQRPPRPRSRRRACVAPRVRGRSRIAHPAIAPSATPTTKPHRCAPRSVCGSDAEHAEEREPGGERQPGAPRDGAACVACARMRGRSAAPTAPSTAVEAPIDTCGGPWSNALSALPARARRDDQRRAQAAAERCDTPPSPATHPP